MENKLNSKDAKRLVEALIRMQADIAQMKRKHELVRWASDIQTPFTLGEILPTFTKTELDKMRQSIGARGLSSLNKQKLASALQKAIVGNAANIFRLLDMSQYNLLKKAVDNGGMTDKFAIDDDQMEYFRNRGILFSGKYKGKKILAVSTEIITEFRKADALGLRNFAQENTEWICLAHGLLHYYGTIPFPTLTAKIAFLSKMQNVDTLRLVEVLVENAVPYYGRMQIGPAGISTIEVSDPARVAREHAARPDVDYYSFTYDEIWRAGAENFIDKNIVFKRFAKFITGHYEIAAQEADDLVEECVWMIQDPETPGQQMSELFDFLQSRLEVDSLETAEQFAHHLMELHNNTRQWILKGHTPNALAQKERQHLRLLPSRPFSLPGITDGNAAGRNSPCPCGSGKKYKKCCGRAE